MNEFSCIGLDIKNSDEMYDFVEANERLARIYETEGRRYLRLFIGDFIEIWYYGREGSGLIDTSMPCIYHKSRYMVPVDIKEILSETEYGPALISADLCGGQVDIPMNLCIADGHLTPEFNNMESKSAAIAMVARELCVFEDEDDYYNQIGDSGLGAECFVPTGIIPENLDEKDDFKPSATALICGKVMNSKRMINPITGLEYIVIGIECLGYMFDILACDELLKDQESLLKQYKDKLPQKGCIISGRYWLTGRLF